MPGRNEPKYTIRLPAVVAERLERRAKARGETVTAYLQRNLIAQFTPSPTVSNRTVSSVTPRFKKETKS